MNRLPPTMVRPTPVGSFPVIIYWIILAVLGSIGLIVSLFFIPYRRLKKFFAHLISRKSEIERICLPAKDRSFLEFTSFHHALTKSKHLRPALSVAVEVGDNQGSTPSSPYEHIFKTVSRLKKIKETSRATPILRQYSAAYCSLRIFGAMVEQRRQEGYNAKRDDHERKLLRLWDLLMPGVQRKGGRISSDWPKIGFQGRDPATDFRGMGILGLDMMLHFAQKYPDAARACLYLSSSIPDGWYPFAITGIFVTGSLVPLLRQGKLDLLLMRYHQDAYPAGKTMADALPAFSFAAYEEDALPAPLFQLRALFNEVYCWMMCSWAMHWISSNPRSPMEFNQHWATFMKWTVEPSLARASLAPPVLLEPVTATVASLDPHLAAVVQKVVHRWPKSLRPVSSPPSPAAPSPLPPADAKEIEATPPTPLVPATAAPAPAPAPVPAPSVAPVSEGGLRARGGKKSKKTE